MPFYCGMVKQMLVPARIKIACDQSHKGHDIRRLEDKVRETGINFVLFKMPQGQEKKLERVKRDGIVNGNRMEKYFHEKNFSGKPEFLREERKRLPLQRAGGPDF